MKKLFYILSLSILVFTMCKVEAEEVYGAQDVFHFGYDECVWAVQCELLYLKAVTDQSAFVEVGQVIFPGLSNVASTQTRITNEQSYKPGFRVALDWMLSDYLSEFQLRYANLYNGNRKNASGLLADTIPVIIAPLGATNIQGSAFSRLSTNYNAGDAVWGRNLFDERDFALDVLFGLHTAYINYKENVKITFPVDPSIAGLIIVRTHQWRSKFWGIGPECGLKGYYACPWLCNLFFSGDVRAALLAGNTKGQYTQGGIASTTGDLLSPLTFKNSPSNWGVIPAFDGRLGINYTWNTWCFNVNFEIGYEMLWYSRPIDKIVLTTGLVEPSDNSALATTDTYSDFSMHGPYAAIRFLF